MGVFPPVAQKRKGKGKGKKLISNTQSKMSTAQTSKER
jgi:hypothetical protein